MSNVKTNTKKPAAKKQSGGRVSFAQTEEYLNKTYDFRYNEVSNSIEYRRNPQSDYEDLCENSVYRNLRLNGLNFPLSDVKALLGSNFVSRYNPIMEYFKELLSWSPEEDEDYIGKLASYVKAKNPERFTIHLKKTFVRMVACAISEKVFNKQALILVDAPNLEGKTGQSMGKTTWCRYLCPSKLEAYYAENPSVDKDGLIAIAENLIINLDELAMMNRGEINQLKSFISKDKIKVRPPFGRKAVSMPRRASFVGSSNNSEFLTDETGSVRWLCFEIYGIDWAYSGEVDIDLCWSQAYNLFLSGFKYNLTSEEIEENERENQKHFVTTPEIDLLQQYYQPSTLSDPKAVFMTATDMVDKISEESGTRVRLNNVKMGKALRFLGFTDAQKFNGRYPVKGYYVKPTDCAAENKRNSNVPF